jgi:hypothetical protein
VWRGWRAAVVIVKPETVLAWHRQGFRLLWTWKSRHRPGRLAVPCDIRALIRTMSDMNPLWGAPRIHGELLKLGIDVCEAKGRTAQPVCSRGQASAIVIGQAQPPGPKLAPQEPVLFDQVRDRLPLPAIQPAGEHAQHHLQRRRSITSRSLYHG